jgi:hypothetical protein
MKMTKDMLKHLIKEVITETNMKVANFSIYREFYSDLVDRRTMRGITNAYKSIIMYARRIEEPRIRNNPETLSREKHYYMKAVNSLEKLLAPVKEKLSQEDAELLQNIIRLAQAELAS